MPVQQTLPVATWDATKYVIVITPQGGASFRVLGPAKGNFVTVSRKTDAFSSEAGAAGDVVRSYNPDQRGDVKLSVMQTSPTNDLLSAIGLADEMTGEGIFTIALEDLGGRTVSSGSAAWLKKLPDTGLATEASNYDWEIEVAQLRHFLGGSV